MPVHLRVGPHDSCSLFPQGDSGGPLVCKLNDTWYLMGLASFSTPCEKPIGPGIFTKVSYYNQWITEKQKSSPNPDPSTAPAEEKPPALFNFTNEVDETGAYYTE